MSIINLKGFGGEQPRIIPQLLPPAGAQSARNVRLDDGALTPIRESLHVADVSGTGNKTIYLFNGTWLTWADVIWAAPGPVDDTRLYYTGDGVPKMRHGTDIYPLALPLPATPTATLGGTGAGDVTTRLYCWTWVTDFGEESEPSVASNSIDWQPGNTVTVSGFTTAPTGRNITKQRIYRSQTGQDGTYFYFIAERAASNGNFSDTVAVDGFGELLPSEDWNAPVDGLAGLVAMSNGMMAAFAGRNIYFCEPFHPHAWPEKYALTADSDIVGLIGLGTTLVILTVGPPAIAAGASPDVMQMDSLKLNLPCINARGIVNLGYSGAYPSNEGLVAVRPDGSAGYVSEPLFSRDEWLALSPGTMIGSQHLGRYVGFIDGRGQEGALFIDIGTTPTLARTDARATAAYFDIPSGGLNYIPMGRGDVWRLDDPDGARTQQYWRSKPFRLPAPENFGAIRVLADVSLSDADELAAMTSRATAIAANQALLDAGPVGGELNGLGLNTKPLNGDLMQPLPSPHGVIAVGVYADGARVATITTTNAETRLPSGFKADTWEIDVSGDLSVSQISMAKTIDELRQVP